MRKTEWSLSGYLRELKTKGKSSWVILKVAAVAYDSFSLHFKRGFTNVVVTSAGCLLTRVVARRASTVQLYT